MKPKVSFTQSAPSVHWLKTNLMSKAELERGVDGRDLLVGEALGLQRAGVDAGRLVEVAVADRIGLDLGDLGLAE